MNRKIEEFVELLPTLQQMYSSPALMTVIDEASILQGYILPPGMEPILKVGDTFEDPTGGLDKVMKSGKKLHNFLPAEVMGSAFEGDLIPIKDNNRVVGVLTATYPSDFEDVDSIKKQFQDSMNEVRTTLNPLFDLMQKIVGNLNSFSGDIDKINSDITSALEILKRINANASKSNILALNASIEAARSGEAGRGFTVVASEMGKLANDSSTSTKDISQFLNDTHEDLNSIMNSIKETNNLSKSYTDEIELIKNALDRISNIFLRLDTE